MLGVSPLKGIGGRNLYMLRLPALNRDGTTMVDAEEESIRGGCGL